MTKDKTRRAEQWQSWYAKHGAERNARRRAGRAIDPEPGRAKQREAYWRDPVKHRTYQHEWAKKQATDPRWRFGRSANKSATRHGIAERIDWLNLPLGPCVYCGTDDETVTWDHVIPLSKGGANAAWNCVRSCIDCNRHKQARTPQQWRDPALGEARKERKRAYIRQWHREHYAELYAKRKAKREATGHW